MDDNFNYTEEEVMFRIWQRASEGPPVFEDLPEWTAELAAAYEASLSERSEAGTSETHEAGSPKVAGEAEKSASISDGVDDVAVYSESELGEEGEEEHPVRRCHIQEPKARVESVLPLQTQSEGPATPTTGKRGFDCESLVTPSTI